MRAVVIALTLISTGALLGNGAAILLGPGLLPAPVPGGAVEPPPPSAPAPRPWRDPGTVLAGALFPAPHEGGDPPPPVGPEADGCPGSLRLVGTVVTGEQQVAAIRVGGSEPGPSPAAPALSGGSRLVRTGMELESREVVQVDANRVVLRQQDGSTCELRMFSGRRAPGPARAVAPVVSLPRPASAPPDLGIRAREDGSVEVPRELVRRATESPLPEMAALRLAFPRRDGRVLGAQVFGVRRGSVLGQLGLRNGDTLMRVNGYDLTSPDDMLAALVALRDAEHLTLQFRRRGELVVRDYHVVP